MEIGRTSPPPPPAYGTIPPWLVTGAPYVHTSPAVSVVFSRACIRSLLTLKSAGLLKMKQPKSELFAVNTPRLTIVLLLTVGGLWGGRYVFSPRFTKTEKPVV